jgi:hypothetical protein
MNSPSVHAGGGIVIDRSPAQQEILESERRRDGANPMGYYPAFLRRLAINQRVIDAGPDEVCEYLSIQISQ